MKVIFTEKKSVNLSTLKVGTCFISSNAERPVVYMVTDDIINVDNEMACVQISGGETGVIVMICVTKYKCIPMSFELVQVEEN